MKKHNDFKTAILTSERSAKAIYHVSVHVNVNSVVDIATLYFLDVKTSSPINERAFFKYILPVFIMV